MRVIFLFPVHADFSGLFHFFSAVWTLGTLWSSCLSDSFCWEIHCTFCLACAALNYLSILPLAEKKLHLSSAPSPLGKTSINIDLLLPLGACLFWCLLLSLIGSYSSKSCQESLEFFPRCVFSRMPRKSWDTQRESIQRVCKLGYLFLFKRPQNAKWIRVLNKAHSWLTKSTLPILLCH